MNKPIEHCHCEGVASVMAESTEQTDGLSKLCRSARLGAAFIQLALPYRFSTRPCLICDYLCLYCMTPSKYYVVIIKMTQRPTQMQCTVCLRTNEEKSGLFR